MADLAVRWPPADLAVRVYPEAPAGRLSEAVAAPAPAAARAAVAASAAAVAPAPAASAAAVALAGLVPVAVASDPVALDPVARARAESAPEEQPASAA